MGDHADWKNLHIHLLQVIAQKLMCLTDRHKFSAVCKSWNSAEFENGKKPYLPFGSHPWLLLAEDTGLDLNAVKVSKLDVVPKDLLRKPPMHDFSDDQTTAVDRIIDCSIVYLVKNINSIRGLFSLATQKVYNLDLPEATDKLILGTNKGWLLTLGRDLEINLLHPLLKEQIPLPPMLTLPSQYEYDDDSFPQLVYTMFITKVVMSSKVPTKSALQHHHTSHLPFIMVIYGEGRRLGFAKLGDKLWTNVEACSGFYDIVYHKKKIYAINFRGEVFVCDIDNSDKKENQHKGTIVTSIPIEKEDGVQCYLIESLCGSYMWVVLRFRKGALYEADELNPGDFWYQTSNFKIFKLEVRYCNSDDAIPTCTWTQEVKELGNETLFIGRASSTSVASSEFIQPNSIYFTDDCEFIRKGGGHDMGIFSVEIGTIQPHFQGISINLISPPLWYI